MAYNPISGFTLQVITQTGEVASDYYLKFYQANTTTPLSMATDSAGGTLLAKAKLSDSGFPISNPLDNSTVFIPHMNANYRLVVYTSEADADADNTAAAYVNVPFVSTLVGASSVGTAAYLDTGTEADELPTNGDLGTAAQVDTGTGAANVPTNAQLAPYLGRNLIINGDFSVWQRGTSQTSGGYGSADRLWWNTSGATFTVSRSAHTLGQTDVQGNPKYYVTDTVATGDDNHSLEHKIEDVTATAGREVTYSFWAKGTNPGGGALSVTSLQNFGTGGSPSTTVETVEDATITLTADWTRYTVTFTPTSVTGKTLGTDGNDFFAIRLGQPATDDSADAYTWDYSNAQLEFGDTATDFEYVNPADQLARCKRYFERLGGNSSDQVVLGISHAPTTTTVFVPIQFNDKRAIPTITDAGAFQLISGANTIAGTITSVADQGLKTAFLTYTRDSGTHTIGDSGFVRCDTGSGNYIDIDAEL